MQKQSSLECGYIIRNELGLQAAASFRIFPLFNGENLSPNRHVPITVRANVAAAVNRRQDLIHRVDTMIVLFERAEIWNFDSHITADWTITTSFLTMARAAIL